MTDPSKKALEIAKNHWHPSGSPLTFDQLLVDDIAAALRKSEKEGYRHGIEEAAKIADDYEGEGCEPKGYNAQLGDAHQTQWDIAKAIRALAREQKR